MRTTLDLPEGLLKDAMRITHQKTKTAVIIHALEDVIQRERVKGIQKFRGKLKLDIDLDTLRGRG